MNVRADRVIRDKIQKRIEREEEDSSETDSRRLKNRNRMRVVRERENDESRGERLEATRKRMREVRDHETQERRDQRLQAERERKRLVRETDTEQSRNDRRDTERRRKWQARRRGRESHENSLEPLENTLRLRQNPSLTPCLPSEELIQQTSERFAAWFTSDNVLLKVCAICNRNLAKGELSKKGLYPRHSLQERMRSIFPIRPEMSLTPRQCEIYDCSDICCILKDLLLAREGCTKVANERVDVQMCNQCSDSLWWIVRALEREESVRLLPPKYAIANSFAFAPILFDRSVQFQERRLVATGDPRGQFCAIKVQKAGISARGALGLKETVITGDQRPSPSMSHVPSEVLSIFKDVFRVAFTSLMASDEDAAACRVVMPRFEVVMEIRDTLRKDGHYEDSPLLATVHARIRDEVQPIL